MSAPRYTATVYDFGHDINGNVIAHYFLRRDGVVIAQSGRLRPQTGYNTYSDAPEIALQEMLGVKTSANITRGSRAEGTMEVLIGASL